MVQVVQNLRERKDLKMPNLIDLTGLKFGRLTVVCRVKSAKPKAIMWRCKCECGKECTVNGLYLREGGTRSCGCLAKDVVTARNYRHGMSHSRLNNIWRDMIRRCDSPNRYAHEYYHDKGVTICDEWRHNFKSFYEWAIDNGYSDKLTIDRIDVNGNYEPGNCRWVTMKKQCNNKTNNVKITFDDRTHTISEWAEITGIKSSTIRARIINYKWDVSKALTTPVKGVI